MMRALISSILAFTFLFSQIGIPLYSHYCKGALESISLFVSNACADHQTTLPTQSCCKKAEATHCKATDNKCCDDEVIVLQKEIQSLVPEWNQYVLTEDWFPVINLPEIPVAEKTKTGFTSQSERIHGPPLFLLHGALIYYA